MKALKKHIIRTSVVALALSAVLCSNYANAKSNSIQVEKQIKDLLDMQSQAWNKGDLALFMTGYLHSPETSYTSGGKVIAGYDALLAHYEKRYGKSTDTMGKLDFKILSIVELGKNNALCLGRWHLVAKDDKELRGIFSLVLCRANKTDGWKVIHDHTSLDSDLK